MRILFTRTIDNHQIQKLEAWGHQVSIVNLLKINTLNSAQDNIFARV